jgi:CRP-like cAMP-binding protein
MTSVDSDLQRLIEKLERLAPLGDASRRSLEGLPIRVEEVSRSQLLVREGDVPTECCVLLQGYACRHKSTPGGARQIVSFHMAGDILDLQHLKLPRADHSVEAITTATIGWIPMYAMSRLLHDDPDVADAFWRDALIDASIFREWVLNVGRRDARARIAHMLCEFAARREASGLGSPDSFDLPMSQQMIADATGLTIVHVNRTLRALCKEGALVREERKLRINDWTRLQQVSAFDPAYLHCAA